MLWVCAGKSSKRSAKARMSRPESFPQASLPRKTTNWAALSIDAPWPDVTCTPRSYMAMSPTSRARSRFSSHMRVCIDPGLMAFTVMGVSANSKARFSVRLVMPILATS